ncbi:bifunctional 23S rRNA (guanine(2069)-N(7))-methyltransferase RlmK/23S rRNA (guanine(2445)-N(2))-methyltransferase RlmL [Endozoicomonas sp. G2_1]|uniref:bifunctional 23S rRNA (guanine(2069)-N(7))-methyltransferase RlmK/23S rRNA (guanine(2445)-N(2))-methyltransferase RlmL n=1 Tax=Endozoicomonas sp. G2_1 TaxID=2821091 RepID=UPI001ADC10CF|nr:bifunctional 23S rRNA (guanine(2069)-N(7))-methyltransferase RlmK/23S rRNA (guanine(2445)-N(2))-methyltransferase RlmL [Endozoicomonas sp. G2_1]MBO9492450.1 bifunctional 23S rRNA (guanine(2069)-N(7))-methyltransferase RlmK/23S rRNA (guanine(2445)-N(2))-methyltransferase RlmL [Endozoicomonas sp. G2_1]
MYQFLALTSPGIESLLAEELATIGAQAIQQKPEGVYFTGNLALGYKVCLWTRLASRVLLQIASAPGQDKEQLFTAAATIDWSDIFSSDQYFAIDFVGKSQSIRNSQFGALTVKDAIVDHFRDKGLARPNVDKSSPDIRFQARLLKGEIAFYLDFSGRGLFQRGYRKDSGAAPLKENLAAALVMRSGWLADTSKPLVDPMCGSGTLLIEAAAMAYKQAPGIDRESWGFSQWLGHDQGVWQQVFDDAVAQSRENKSKQNQLKQRSEGTTLKLFGSDLDSRVVKTAQYNARQAGFAQDIDFQCRDANKLTNRYAELGEGTLLFNPPYGERIGELPELVETFALLGGIVKQQFIGWRLAIFTASVELLSLLKLASFKRYKLKNGPLDCQLALYNLDEKQSAKDKANGQALDLSGQDSAFANRLKKNIKALKSWIKSENIDCYRLYDADIPEYNVAVDVYQDHLIIQEYAAPANIPPEKTAKRLQEVIFWAPKVLAIDTAKVVLKTRQKQKGSSQYQQLAKSKQALVVNEYGAKLKVNLWDYLDTGLFLDHRKTRQIVAKKANNKRFLNLFAYTGSVSVQAALRGASHVTTVDMSNTYLQWAQENFALNKLVGSQYQFVQDNCLAWLKQQGQLEQQPYQLIFIDPPTFSNSKRMEDSFDVQRDHLTLLADAEKLLAEDGEIVFTNNKRNFKIDVDGLAELGLKVQNISDQTRDRDFKRNIHIHNSWLVTRI